MANSEAISVKPAVPATVSTEARSEVTSAEDFLTKSALYVTTRVDGFSPPRTISFECTGACNKETTWHRAYDAAPVGSREGERVVPDYSVKSVSYICFHCGQEKLIVFYREMKSEKRTFTTHSTSVRLPPSPPSQHTVIVGVMKIGQYPELTVEIAKPVAKTLGKDATALYRKALICRNHGFGLAAASYMRRVVEDKTNELIEIAAQLAETHGIDATIVTQIRAAADSKKYTAYDEKLSLAATVFPASLSIGGANPLGVLYGLVSKGLHGLGEEECVAIADETRGVFEYVFAKLRAEVDDRKTFVEKMKKLAQ